MRATTPSPGRFASARGAIGRWLVAGVIGLLLGAYVVAFSTLPLSWTLAATTLVLVPFVVMVVGHVEKLLLGIIIVEIPLGIDDHLWYQEAAAELGAVGGLNVSLTTFCLALLYALWLAQLLAKFAAPTPHLLRESLPLMSYLALTALSLFVAPNAALAGFYMVMLLQAFLIYLYVIHWVRTREDVRFVATTLLAGLALQGLIIIGVRFAGLDLNVASISTQVNEGFGLRGGGTLGSPNGAAGYLSLLLAPALGVLMSRWGWRRGLAALALALGCVALLVTQSRGGWAAFALSGTLYYGVAWWRGWLSLRVHVVALVAVLAFAFTFQNDVVTRLSGDDSGAAYSRIPLMKLTFGVIQDAPLLGVGVNNFAVTLKDYLTPEFGREWAYTVHNKFLLIWAESGPAALVAFLWFLAATLRRGWRVSARGGPLAPLALGLTVALVGHAAHMNVDIFTDRPYVQMLWLLAGLIVAISRVEGARRGARQAAAR